MKPHPYHRERTDFQLRSKGWVGDGKAWLNARIKPKRDHFIRNEGEYESIASGHCRLVAYPISQGRGAIYTMPRSQVPCESALLAAYSLSYALYCVALPSSLAILVWKFHSYISTSHHQMRTLFEILPIGGTGISEFHAWLTPLLFQIHSFIFIHSLIHSFVHISSRRVCNVLYRYVAANEGTWCDLLSSFEIYIATADIGYPKSQELAGDRIFVR